MASHAQPWVETMQEKPVAIGCGTVLGVDATPVTIEVTNHGEVERGPKILGLVDMVVREAYHRILCAYMASGIPSPRGIPTINFLPAGIRKRGSCFDLPMALALAGASDLVPRQQFANLAALGEVTLEGKILPVCGAVAIAIAARDQGRHQILSSRTDAEAAAIVPGINIYGVETLAEAVSWLLGKRKLQPARPRRAAPPPQPLDLEDIHGHETPKTALVVAAAGRHNLLFAGPPGSGKSALVRRLPGLLPPANTDEALEIIKIHTLTNPARSAASASRSRPLRSPHHTSSAVSLLGGGSDPRPGEVTLAQNGVLFLDELPEFRREALEGLRQPLEDGSITIGRALRTVTMPADFLLVGAMNPCPCGYLGHPTRPCVCPPSGQQRYFRKLSGPLIDRFDLQVEVPALDPSCFRQASDPAWSTTVLRERVLVAFDRQRHRNNSAQGWKPNGRLEDHQLERVAGSDDRVHDTLEDLLRIYKMSGRSRVRILRIARTLADLDDRDDLTVADIRQATRLRGAGALLDA